MTSAGPSATRHTAMAPMEVSLRSCAPLDRSSVVSACTLTLLVHLLGTRYPHLYDLVKRLLPPPRRYRVTPGCWYGGEWVIGTVTAEFAHFWKAKEQEEMGHDLATHIMCGEEIADAPEMQEGISNEEWYSIDDLYVHLIPLRLAHFVLPFAFACLLHQETVSVPPFSHAVRCMAASIGRW